MLRAVSNNERASSAETGVDSGDDRRPRSGLASWLDSAPPVLAFGSQNLTALLVELRRRERRAAWRSGAWLHLAHLSSSGADQHLGSGPSCDAPSSAATDCKEQP